MARGLGNAPLCRHGTADTVNFGGLKASEDVAQSTDGAVFQSDSMALIDKALTAALQRRAHLAAKAGVGKLGAAAGGQLPIQPGGAITGDLLVEIEGESVRAAKSFLCVRASWAMPRSGRSSGIFQ